MKFLAFALTALLLNFFASCVPTRKYNDLLTKQTACEKVYRDSLAELRKCKNGFNTEVRKNSDLMVETEKLKVDLAEARSRYEHTKRLNDDLNELYEKLIKQNKDLNQKAINDAFELSQEQSRLKKELEETEDRLARLQVQLDERSKSIDIMEKELREREAKIGNLSGNQSALEKNLAEREKKVKELEDALALQKKESETLRNNLKSALHNFDASELSIEEKEGKIYVSLSQKLLFAPGSKVMDKKGKDALAKLAGVLAKNKDMSILVEGHTDSDGEDLANWELSTGRAVTIVTELTKGGVTPERITAAGRGEHLPVFPNTSPDNKAKNRRTEIILAPDLSKVLGILK